MKRLSTCYFILYITTSVCAQDSIHHRFIFIGNAGISKDETDGLVETISKRFLIKTKTSVISLGNNLPGRPLSYSLPELRASLHKRFAAIRDNSVPVYLLPGASEWSNGGSDGYENALQFHSLVKSLNDSLIKVVPDHACPGPYELEVSEKVSMIFMDTEWLLFPFTMNATASDGCECTTGVDVLAALEQLLYANRLKTVFLVTYHPLRSNGFHGGNFSWSEHIFPLTHAYKNFYLPLPGVGSLYAWARRVLPASHDLHHPDYQNLIRAAESVIRGFKNVVVVSGHDPSLQILPGEYLQIVSAAFSHNGYARQERASVVGRNRGFIIADYFSHGGMRLSMAEWENNECTITHQYDHVPKSQSQFDVPLPTEKYADSLLTSVKARYDSVTKRHRLFFGENYRFEWAAEEKLPVLRLSAIKGGLKPVKLGGGMQTLSLRLKDPSGAEWVLRKVEKNAGSLLPAPLRQTFVGDILDDEMSAQHLYAPLIVPVLANAAGVPHAHPVIGVAAADKELGLYNKLFANKVVLLEEREPLGNSVNTFEMMEKLVADNDNSIDGAAFLKARLLDVLISDWDRHPDQWRWVGRKEGKAKVYIPIPRDRDQALYKNEGVFPTIASWSWIMPMLQGFQDNIPKPKYSIMKAQFLNAFPSSQLNLKEWMKISREFQLALTDSVINQAVDQLPAKSLQHRRSQLIHDLKNRRDEMERRMFSVYRFINRIVDVRLSDKHESVELRDTLGTSLVLEVFKMTRDGQRKQSLLYKIIDEAVTREIRLYLEDGNDRVHLDFNNRHIKVRLIGGRGEKYYDVARSGRKTVVYDFPESTRFTGNVAQVKKVLRSDSANVRFARVNLYNKTQPLLNLGFNLDDGLLFGVGVRHFHEGFRKLPYGSVQEIMATKAFATNAFKVHYRGVWSEAIGKSDLSITTSIQSPTNTQNFFGRGNETVRITGGNKWMRYYRARFNLYELGVRLERDLGSNYRISAGPNLQRYSYDPSENIGRLTSESRKIGSADSLSIAHTKIHGGAWVTLVRDGRNNQILPTSGYYHKTELKGNLGITGYAKDYVQLTSELCFYKALTRRRFIVMGQRFGAGYSFGQPAFYQSLFLGGHENLYGFSQYRFAGMHVAYSNTELRIKIAQVGSYVLPGQLGLTTFFDTGRVWETREHSHVWHYGYGCGVYFSPIELAVFQFTLGKSTEGVFPYFTIRFRY